MRPWRDPRRPVRERVDALLTVMTLEDTVGQLGSRWVFDHLRQADDESGVEHRVAPVTAMTDADSSAGLEEASRYGLGQLTRVYGSVPVSPVEGAAVVRRQHVVMGASRLGIPAMVHEECLTGFTAYGATVYPTSLAWGATFDPDLVRRMAASIGQDMVRLGVHQGLAPVLDVVRDYRWGRVEECIAEDSHLVATVGSAYVSGLESAGLVATLKHFAGCAASRGARNHGPVSMGRRELVDVILPPFEAAVTRGGARSVMTSYTDVDGVPCAADAWLLTDVLRRQWGFTGTVVADYGAVSMLEWVHRTAGTPAEAGGQALAAGLDVELPDTACFGEALVGGVNGGATPEALVDRAVRRVLTQKVDLGLLDEGWTPEACVAGAGDVDLDSAENRALAREVAERSIILLDAGTALPLLGDGRTPPRRVAVVGPCADDARTLLGCYSFPNHVLPGFPQPSLGLDITTPLTALRDELPGVDVLHESGCSVLGDDRTGLAGAAAAAASAEVCVAFVGDLAGMFGKGSSGEGCDAEDLRLPGVQADLLDALFATGTPVVVVVVSGRPYALGAWSGRAAGLVQAFMPGAEGGAALAGVLTGRVNPGGRLPVQVPRTPSQVSSYLQPPLGGGEDGFASTLVAAPLYPFGHGASYTQFALQDLRLSHDEIATDGEVSVTVRVRNTGRRRGDEVVQMYLRDPVAQVVRPVRQLVGFARVGLEPGAAADVTFRLRADRTSYPLQDLRRIVEAGDVELLVGTSAADLPLCATVRLTGATRVVGADRRLHTPVDVVHVPADGS